MNTEELKAIQENCKQIIALTLESGFDNNKHQIAGFLSGLDRTLKTEINDNLRLEDLLRTTNSELTIDHNDNSRINASYDKIDVSGMYLEIERVNPRAVNTPCL